MAQQRRSRLAYGTALLAAIGLVLAIAGNWSSAQARSRSDRTTLGFVVRGSAVGSTMTLIAPTDEGRSGITVSCTIAGTAVNFTQRANVISFPSASRNQRRVLGNRSSMPPSGARVDVLFENAQPMGKGLCNIQAPLVPVACALSDGSSWTYYEGDEC